jgi:predicted MPP superfamily phosphohydrolase
MKANLLEFAQLLTPTQWVVLWSVVFGSLALWLTFVVWLWRAWRIRRGDNVRRPARWLRLAVYALCAVYAATFAYARWIEPQRLVLKRLTITSPKIPAGRTLRLAHATDLHADWVRRDHLARAATAIADLRPDAVLLTGDFLCNLTDGAPAALVSFLLRLPDVPIYAVTGNYGGRYPPDPYLETLGVDVMHTETRLAEIAGVPVEIHGASPARRVATVRRPRHPERFGIFLEHFPALLPHAARAGWNLFVGGHTHAGQVRLPFYGALVTLDPTGKEYEMGAYRLGDTVGFIGAGIGMECRGVPQVRFLCPPEIALIEVVGSGYSPK